MEESALIELSILVAIIGLISLYFVSQNINVDDYTSGSNDGEDVAVKGKISKITDSGKVVFLEVQFDEKAAVIVFSNNSTLSLAQGDNVEIIGKVQRFEGKNQIIARTIKVS